MQSAGERTVLGDRLVKVVYRLGEVLLLRKNLPTQVVGLGIVRVELDRRVQIFQGTLMVAVVEITQGALVQTGGVAQLFVIGHPVVRQLAWHLSCSDMGELECGGEAESCRMTLGKNLFIEVLSEQHRCHAPHDRLHELLADSLHQSGRNHAGFPSAGGRGTEAATCVGQNCQRFVCVYAGIDHAP